MAKKKVIFHKDNALVHMCAVSMAKLHELGYELVPHPPYSPDLASSEYFVFANLKKWLGGKRFSFNDEIIDQTNAYFIDLKKSYFLEEIQKWENHWTKCIQLKGYIFFCQKKLFFMRKVKELLI